MGCCQGHHAAASSSELSVNAKEPTATLLSRVNDQNQSAVKQSLCGLSERSAAINRLFDILDRNGDGQVVASEFLEFLRVCCGHQGTTTKQAENSMAFKDKNHDGMLSQSELETACEGVDVATLEAWCDSLEKAKAIERLFDALDNNKDGKIVPAEFLEFLRESMAYHSTTLQQAEKTLAFKDKDKDGMLSLTELKTACDGVEVATIVAWCKSLETSGAIKRLFIALDKNGDGQIMPAEFLEFLRESMGYDNATLQQAEKSLAFKDKDKDGMLSLTELKTACEGVEVATIVAWCKSLEMSGAIRRLFVALDKNGDGKIMPAEFLEFLREAMGHHSVTLQQAEKSLAFKDKDKDGMLSETELKTACEGVEVATILAWCTSLEKPKAIKVEI